MFSSSRCREMRSAGVRGRRCNTGASGPSPPSYSRLCDCNDVVNLLFVWHLLKERSGEVDFSLAIF